MQYFPTFAGELLTFPKHLMGLLFYFIEFFHNLFLLTLGAPICKEGASPDNIYFFPTSAKSRFYIILEGCIPRNSYLYGAYIPLK